MSININTILDWFKSGKKPTEQQFADSWQSFWHKDEIIPQAIIENLESDFNLKANESDLEAHINDPDAHGGGGATPSLQQVNNAGNTVTGESIWTNEPADHITGIYPDGFFAKNNDVRANIVFNDFTDNTGTGEKSYHIDGTKADGDTFAMVSDIGTYVPYTGATGHVDLGTDHRFGAGYVGGGYGDGTSVPAFLAARNPVVPAVGSTSTVFGIYNSTGVRGFYSYADENDVQYVNNRGGGNQSTNSAFGNYALRFNTTGTNNAAFGYGALYSNTTGIINAAFGEYSLYRVTTGTRNAAFGSNSLSNLTTGSFNTAIASQSGIALTTGDRNTLIGQASGESLNQGRKNTFIGRSAGSGITTGISNIVLTHGWGGEELPNTIGLTTGSYNTLIGYVKGLLPEATNNVIIADGSGNRLIDKNENKTIITSENSIEINSDKIGLYGSKKITFVETATIGALFYNNTQIAYTNKAIIVDNGLGIQGVHNVTDINNGVWCLFNIDGKQTEVYFTYIAWDNDFKGDVWEAETIIGVSITFLGYNKHEYYFGDVDVQAKKFTVNANMDSNNSGYFNVGENSINMYAGGNGGISIGTGGVNINGNAIGVNIFGSGPNGVSIAGGSGSIKLSGNGGGIYLDGQGGPVNIATGVGGVGAVYAADYSDNYTDRSLVDKAYVDSVAGTGTATNLQSIMKNGSSAIGLTTLVEINTNDVLALNGANFVAISGGNDTAYPGISNAVSFGGGGGTLRGGKSVQVWAQGTQGTSNGAGHLSISDGNVTLSSNAGNLFLWSYHGSIYIDSQGYGVNFGSGQINLPVLNSTTTGTTWLTRNASTGNIESTLPGYALSTGITVAASSVVPDATTSIVTNMSRIWGNLLSIKAYGAKSAAYSLTATDDVIDVTGATTANMTLPTSVSRGGKKYTIKNSGTGVVTILTTSSQTIDGATSYVLPANNSAVTLVSDNGSNWKIISAYNIQLDGVLNKTAGYTILYSDYGKNGQATVYADATAGAITITLEAAASMAGKTVNVIKTDTSANAITVKGNGTTNINAANTLVLSAQYQAATVKSNSTQYYAI